MANSIRIPVFATGCMMFMTFCLNAINAAQSQSKKDLEAIQGTWIGQKWVNAGESAPADKVAQLTLTFKGDQVLVGSEDAATIRLDATKTPSEADFVDKSNKPDRGIYRLDGDTLTFCMVPAESGKDRPSVFESTKENGYMLIVLKRR